MEYERVSTFFFQTRIQLICFCWSISTSTQIIVWVCAFLFYIFYLFLLRCTLYFANFNESTSYSKWIFLEKPLVYSPFLYFSSFFYNILSQFHLFPFQTLFAYLRICEQNFAILLRHVEYSTYKRNLSPLQNPISLWKFR